MKADGTVLTLGSDTLGTVGTLAGATGVKSVDGSAASFSFGFNTLTKTDGSVAGFGYVNGAKGGLGQVGGAIGTTTLSTPTAINQLTDVAELRVLSGSGTVIARKNDGTVWLLAGSINISSVLNVAISAKQINLSGVVVALGDTIGNINGTDIAPLVMSDGSVQMATISPANSGIPAAYSGNQNDYTGSGVYAGIRDATYTISNMTGVSSVVQVSCAGMIGSNIINPNQYHCLALTSSGVVWSWGGVNSDGQLGNGGTNATETPFQVNNLSDVVQVKAGKTISLALTKGGAVYSWGDTTYLGRSIAIGNDAYVPERVTSISESIVEISDSGNIFARSSTGSVWAWGSSFGVSDGRPLRIDLPEKLVGINLN